MVREKDIIRIEGIKHWSSKIAALNGRFAVVHEVLSDKIGCFLIGARGGRQNSVVYLKYGEFIVLEP